MCPGDRHQAGRADVIDDTTTATDPIAEAEARITNSGVWVLPILVSIGVLAWRSVEPVLVTLDRDAIRIPFAHADIAIAAAAALAAFAYALAWKLLLGKTKSCVNRSRSVSAALILTLGGVVGCEVLMRTDAVQSTLWRAVNSRLGPADWFVGNVARIRLEMAARGEPAPTGKVVIVGSSQAAAGFDQKKLAEALGGRKVVMRGIGDMDARRILLAMNYLDIGPTDTAILYLSSRDVAASMPFTMNWMRPFASPEGARELLGILGPRRIVAEWTQAIDLALAAVLEMWRSRDYVRHVTDRLLVASSGVSAGQQMLQRDLDADLGITAGEEEKLVDLQFRALDRSLQLLASKASRVVVVEGRMNPAHLDDREIAMQGRLADYLSARLPQLGVTFVPENSQPFENPPEDWADATHLNSVGSGKLTAFVAELLHRSVWAAPKMDR